MTQAADPNVVNPGSGRSLGVTAAILSYVAEASITTSEDAFACAYAAYCAHGERDLELLPRLEDELKEITKYL